MAVIRFLMRWFIRFLHYVFLPVLVVLCLLARFWPKKFDVGMGPQPLINNIYWAKALKLKGYSVQTFADAAYHITQEFDINYANGFWRIFYFFPALSFLRCCFYYRCMYVYFDGGSLRHVPGLRLLEPMLLRLAGVKSVVMPYGSDVQIHERTANKKMANALCIDYPEHFQKKHKKIIRQVEAWSTGADIVIGAMDSIDYLFFWNRIRHCHFAFDTDAVKPCYPVLKKGDTIKIIHAPNHLNIKGTHFIISAVETLQNEGYPVVLELLQGKSNVEVLKIMQTAHIAVDQLIIGTYAMFAIEAMANGKPVVGFMRPDHVRLYEDLGCVDFGEIPIIQAETRNITQVLRKLLDEPESLFDIGKKTRKYVQKYHCLDAVGDFYDEINRSIGLKPKKL